MTPSFPPPSLAAQIEAVAQALYECWPDYDDGAPIPWANIVEMDHAEPYYTAARAAIATLERLQKEQDGARL